MEGEPKSNIPIVEKEQKLEADSWIEKMRDPDFLPVCAEMKSYLKCVGGFVSSPENKRWLEYCEGKGNPVYEIYTKEFIEALSIYLENRLDKMVRQKKDQL